MTAENYAAACHALSMRGGRAGAFDRYARVYREGVIDDPLAPVHIPPIGRTHHSESEEGVTVKFTQRVPRAMPHATAPAAPSSPGASSPLSVLNSAPAQPDTLEVESVLIPMIGRTRQRAHTLCVSSQVGCAMGCTFCQTAQMGLVRSLTTAEIVAQWFAAMHVLQRPDPESRVSNIVFMGMGEPMDNLDNVIGAIEILTDRRGPNLSMSKITVSTVGRIDGIRKLAHRVRQTGWHRLGLAISLNAPSDEVRSTIMPVNRAMPMRALREELLAWPFFGGAHLCLEYVLIPGVNDSPLHAAQLASFVNGEEAAAKAREIAIGEPPALSDDQRSQITPYDGPALRGLVNLIPYNPREGSPWGAPDEAEVDRFVGWMRGLGVYCKRRRTKGRDTMAACGQLGNLAYKRQRSTATAGAATTTGAAIIAAPQPGDSA
jgi:23S rRNA (adenine2503-C2)-methyltransferase